MNQPYFWSVLVAAAVVVMGLRLVARQPLWPRRSTTVPPMELAVAVLMVAALVFHCASMFFADWVDAILPADGPARAVRELGVASQVAYWVPAAGLVVALRRVWPPALGLLVLTLVGVGYTMFVPHTLTIHLAWIAAATISLVVLVAAFVARGQARTSASSLA